MFVAEIYEYDMFVADICKYVGRKEQYPEQNFKVTSTVTSSNY